AAKLNGYQPGMAESGASAARLAGRENLTQRRLGGGRGTVVKPSPSRFQQLTNHTDCRGCCLENPLGYLMVSTCFLSHDSHVKDGSIFTGSLSTAELNLLLFDGVPLADQF